MNPIIYVILGIIAILVLWVIGTYNGFIGSKNKVDEAFSTMDIVMKKRYDLIPNIVETVKGYAKHESETLEQVISARAKAVSSGSVEERLEAEQGLSGALGRLMAISESYPNLKADTNFLDLQNQLKNMEGEIASSRKYYNAVVKEYNVKVERIPSNIIAGIFGFKKRPLFELSSEAERENVQVTF